MIFAPISIFWTFSALAKTPDKLVSTADQLLELAQISYVYGGSALGDGETCALCKTCLEEKSPDSKKRLTLCPVCRECSLDCSHFTELVYRLSGLPYPYLDTKLMIGLSAERLLSNYGLQDLGTRLDLVQPGDLLVYPGHVVMLERMIGLSKGVYRGDVIHATGGKDIKLPGQGIQRERYAELRYFRGTLQRILRHRGIQGGSVPLVAFDTLSAEPPAKVAPLLKKSAPKKETPKPENKPRLRPVK